MAGFADVERLRQQNVSLLRRLQENQHKLKHSVQSAKHFTTATEVATPIRENRLPREENNTRSPKGALDLSAVHVTSTPKPVPTKTYTSPMHRSRTEILDTTPQEILSSDSVNFGIGQSQYLSRLGPRQDEVLCDWNLGAKSQKRLGKSRTSPQKRSGKGMLTSKMRSSPRNFSFIGAPDRKTPKGLHSAGNNYRVLNGSILDHRRGTTPTQQRPQSAILSETSPGHQRYNLRRPNSATPSFGRSQCRSRQSIERTPKQYHSQFLNSYYSKEHPQSIEKIRLQKSWYPERMLDAGNARSRSRRVLDTTPKPKSILLTPANKSCKAKNSMRVSFRESPNTSLTSLRPVGPDSSGHVQPLLGYDWIAGLLDADGHVSEKSEAYLAELQEFRQTNYDECVHKSLVEEPDTELNTSHPNHQLPTTEPKEKPHKCIHNYALNDRLFPVPLHGTETGESLCAICNARRKLDSNTVSPSYIRVSIPRSTLRSPYQIRPHRRKSFDPTDSVGLSQHCLAGWENSLPSMMPAASHIDLKDSLGYTISQSQSLFMDKEDATGQPARTRRPLVPSIETQQLLNRSRSLRLELQKLEKAGLSQARTANSTQYPVL